MNAAGRVRELREAIRARMKVDSSPIAAIELVSVDSTQRKADRDLVREALRAGATAAELEELLVCVFADLAFEVDWRDQFSFWPLLHERLRSEALDLRQHEARRAVAREFERFSTMHNGVKPAGELAAQFSLMSWPLVHALMPRPALRHVAAAIAKAATLGLTPSSVSEPWRADLAQALSAASEFPLFVSGIIESSDALEKVGRALLFPSAPSSNAGWAARARDALERDVVARDLVEDARADTTRSSRSGQISLPITLVLSCVGDSPAELSLRFGPIDTQNEHVLAFARTAAELRVQAGGKHIGKLLLSDAIRGTGIVSVDSPTLPLEVVAKVAPEQSEDIVPPPLQRSFSQTFVTPVAFSRSSDGVFERCEDLRVGDDAAVLLRSDAPAVARTPRRSVCGSTALVAVLGQVDEQLATALGLKRSLRRARLYPRVTLPLRQSAERLTYEEGRAAWLELEGVQEHDELLVSLKAGADEVALERGTDEEGRVLLRTPPLTVGEHELVVRAPLHARAIASMKLSVVRRQVAHTTRWRATLRPEDATVTHLESAQCSLDVDALPSVDVEIAVRFADREPEAAVLTRDERRSRPRIAQRIAKLYASQRGEGPAPQSVEILAREPGNEPWTTVATLAATPAGLRFDLSTHPITAQSPDDEASVYRLQLDEAEGARLVASGAPREPGVYIAAAAQARAAVAIADRDGSMPRITRTRARKRSAERCVELLSMLRAIDTAALAPRGAEGAALLLRNAAARSVERELVLALCGGAWVALEDEHFGCEWSEDLIRAMARLLWLPEEQLLELSATAEDPVEALGQIGLLRDGSRPNPLAEHLTLALCCRGLTTRSRDLEASRWAILDVQRGRAARSAALLFLRQGAR
jgi:hypothetical protein